MSSPCQPGDLDRLLSSVEAGAVPHELSWLLAFDEDDLNLCVCELRHALDASRDNGAVELDELLRAWMTTAETLNDPLRRAVLLSEHHFPGYSPAGRRQQRGQLAGCHAQDDTPVP